MTSKTAKTKERLIFPSEEIYEQKTRCSLCEKEIKKGEKRVIKWSFKGGEWAICHPQCADKI